MNRKTAAALTGSATALVLGAVGCSGGTATVSGNRDDVKHVMAITRAATRPVYRNECQTKWRTVSKTTGSGKTRSTSTSRQSYQDCHQVQSGTENYTKTVTPEKWCVELDNVNGDKTADDRWYNVTSSTYHKWASRRGGAVINKMIFNHSGC